MKKVSAVVRKFAPLFASSPDGNTGPKLRDAFSPFSIVGYIDLIPTTRTLFTILRRSSFFFQEFGSVVLLRERKRGFARFARPKCFQFSPFLFFFFFFLSLVFIFVARLGKFA